MIVFFIVVLIISFVIIAVSSLTIKIEILNLRIDNLKRDKTKEFEIRLKIYIFKKIRILKSVLNKEKTNKINKDIIDKIKQKIDIKILNKLIIPEILHKHRKKTKKHLKRPILEIEEFMLNLKIGTTDVLLTTLLIPIISTIVATFLSKNSENIEYENINYKILPIYGDKNLYSLEFKCIITLKLVHIIYVIYMLKKGKKVGDKFGRASNRKFNANCNV